MTEPLITRADPEIAERFERFLLQESGPPSSEVSEAEATEAEAPVQEDSAAPEPAPEPEPEPEEAPASEEPETEEVTEESAEPAEEEDPGVETISDLAAAFDVEEVDLVAHLQLPNREGDGTVSLADVIESYRKQPEDSEQSRLHYENLGKELRGEHDERLGEMQKLTSAMIAHINTDPEVDWDMLRDTDPAGYLREREKRDARQADVERSLKEMDAEIARRGEEDAKQHNVWRQEQIETLYRLRPDWKDQELGRAAMNEVTDYLHKTGYPEDQIESLEDAKSILTVWRAAQWEKLQDKKPEMKKKLRLLPRTLRSSAIDDAASITTEQADQERKVALRQRLAESGSVEDAARLLEAMKL